jgi:hypothetical protein
VTYDSRPEIYEHIARVRMLMMRAAFALLVRGHVHDASKLVEPELSIFDVYRPKLKDTECGSDEYQRYLDFVLGSFQPCSATSSIAPSAVNRVGETHTFTVNVNRKLGTSRLPPRTARSSASR